jgi:hypothetical protein
MFENNFLKNLQRRNIMIKKEIVIAKEEQMLQQIKNILDITNNICIMVNKDVVERISCKNEKRLEKYIEYTWQEEGEKTVMMLEDIEGEYMKLRRFTNNQICFMQPIKPKNMLILNIAA